MSIEKLASAPLRVPLTAALLLASAPALLAQNDECVNAIPLAQGATYFDTAGATTSPEPWPCAPAGSDLWFRYTKASALDLVIETCGSTFDTALEVFTGACGSLFSIGCRDSGCGLQSSLTLSQVPAGTTVTLRVGGSGGATGAGLVSISELPPPQDCVETLFAANGGGSVGGAMYFDLTTAAPISVGSLQVNTNSTGSGLGVDLYTVPGSYSGNESNAAAWTLSGIGLMNGVGQGPNGMTPLEFISPVILPAGTTGIALVAKGFGHAYTNGNGTNQSFTSPNGQLRLDLGAASNVPFAGIVFVPRVWNGRICDDSLLCSCFCLSNPNSTGVRAQMFTGGSASVAANDLVLSARQLPAQALGYFITSMTPGFVANPNGSSGNLCLSGAIGRFVGPGEVQSSGASGSFLLVTDNARQPSPTGLLQIVPGQTWVYQAWFRDQLPSGVATSNFTDALQLTFGS